VSNKPPVTVIGCGVIGLTTAIRLLEEGHAVTVIGKTSPHETTSSVAAAFWHPYKVGVTPDVYQWCKETFDVYARLAEEPASGVSPITITEYFDAPEPDPFWKNAVHHFRRLTSTELPSSYCDGFEAGVMLVDTPIHIEWLMMRLKKLGGALHLKTLQSFSELDAAVVVNCSGLGARELVGDSHVYPIRGQVIRVTTSPALKLMVGSLKTAHTYIVPRHADCILGGTAQENNWNTAPDTETADDIFSRCLALQPSLAEGKILSHLVGLRPARFAVRLEKEIADGKIIIHNYGHGGSGYTLAWGCANDVVRLAG
jgi:D-amino-acid oxidase